MKNQTKEGKLTDLVEALVKAMLNGLITRKEAEIEFKNAIIRYFER